MVLLAEEFKHELSELSTPLGNECTIIVFYQSTIYVIVSRFTLVTVDTGHIWLTLALTR